MAATNGKPKGFHQYVLAGDCETTGLCFNTDRPTHNPKTGERHQAVSWGLVVLDSETLEQIDEMYIEIRWNEASLEQREDDPKFGTFAEKIHGLTQSHLEEHGVSEEEAIEQIWEFLSKYWGPTSCISMLGHNVHLFDLDFFRDLFRRNGIELRFGNRHLDTHSMAWAAFETYTSDEVFALLGHDARGAHNALDDIKMSIHIAKTVRDIVQNALAG